MAEWDMTTPPERDHTPVASDEGNLDSPSSYKKLAKFTDLCGKVATEVGGSRFPLLSKMVPLATKSMRTGADAREASMCLDEGAFAEVAWESSSATSNLMATAIALAGGTQLFLTRQIEQSVMGGVNRVLLAHIAESSQMSRIVTGIWNAEPFITRWGATEMRGLLGSDAARKISANLVQSALDGAPATREMVQGYRSLFRDIDRRAFFKTPELPATSLEAGARAGLDRVPGLTSDATRLAPVVRFGTMMAANVLPGASVLLDGYGLSNAWSAYTRQSDAEAKGDAMASLLCSAIVMTGSVMNAVGMNTRTSSLLRPGLKTPLLGLGLSLMFAGAGGSYFMEQYVAQKSADKASQKTARWRAQKAAETSS